MKGSIAILLALFGTSALASSDQILNSNTGSEQLKLKEKLSLYRRNELSSVETADIPPQVNQANLIEESSAQINEIDSRSSLNLNKPTLTQSSATATATASGASPQVTNSTGYVATFMQPFNSITVTLTAGSQNTPLTLTLDMYSPNTQVSSNITDPFNIAPVYLPMTSATLTPDSVFRFRTGTYNLIGYWGKDQVCMGNGMQTQALLNNNGVKAKTGVNQCWQQDFLHAYWNTESIWPYSGVLGFGFNVPTYGTHILQQKGWQAAQWGYLGAIYPSNKTIITMGGVNPAYIAANDQLVSYNVIQGSTKWTIQLSSMSYNSGTSTTNVATALKATFDVNEEGIRVPPQVFGTISTAWQKQAPQLQCKGGICWFNGLCQNFLNTLGSFTFKFGDNRSYTIPWNAYFQDTQLMTCQMQVYAASQSEITIGDSFLEHFYTVYDVNVQTVSIALGSYTWGSVSNY